MTLLTRLSNYTQKLSFDLFFALKNKQETGTWSVNKFEKRQGPVYTPKNRAYDWELEEAIERHPSNYKNRSK